MCDRLRTSPLSSLWITTTVSCLLLCVLELSSNASAQSYPQSRATASQNASAGNYAPNFYPVYNHNRTVVPKFNSFDWNLTKTLLSDVKDNIVLSPISVKLILGMLYLGAKGNTSDQLQAAFGSSEITKQDIAIQLARVLNSLEAPHQQYDLDIGTKLFIDKDAQLRPSYEQTLMRMYNASIQNIDFKKTREAVQKINQWAESVTRGHIQNLVSEADAVESTVLLLLNAVYFNGTWEHPFLRNETKDDYFYVDGLKRVKTDFMTASRHMDYIEAEELKCEIVRLPYMGGKLSMSIILPFEETTIDAVMSIVNQEILRILLDRMESTQVELSLPKFKFDYASNLRPILQKLGIQDIFTINADLTEIASSPKQHLMVSNVIQKAGIEINEEGSIAYATTVAELASKFGDSPVKFRANRPFVFFIEDSSTDTIVFVGKVENPDSEGKQKVDPDAPLSQRHPLPSDVSPFVPYDPMYEGSGYYNKAGEFVPQMFDQVRLSYFDAQLGQLLSSTNSGNWIVSPSSLKTILGMVYEGSAGRTEEELSIALRLSANRTMGLHQIYALQRELNSVVDPSVAFKSANRILVSLNYPLMPNFKATMLKKFKSDVDNFNFSSPTQVANHINDWVNISTKGLITDLITPDLIDPRTELVLLNAVYFKGEWEAKFSQNETTNECFYVSRTQCKMASMMKQSNYFKYGILKSLSAQIVELPYSDDRFSMVIVVPLERGGLADVVRNLPFNPILPFLNTLHKSEVVLAMPKFSVTYEREMKDIMMQMGIRDLFSNAADLRNIFGEKKSKVDAIFHKAKFIVNEMGSEGGAGSAGFVVPLMVNQRTNLIVDQPFLFFLRDIKSGFIFSGQIVDPTAE